MVEVLTRTLAITLMYRGNYVKKLIIAAGLLGATMSAPAMAQDFAGPRVGAEIGILDDDFLGSEETSWGVNAGYDFDLGQTVAGVTVAYNGLFDDDGLGIREISAGGRFGPKLSDKTLVYVSAAYSNIDADNVPGSLDGVKLGLGLEYSFGNAYANIETRYGNYEADAELYQTVIGLGYRF